MRLFLSNFAGLVRARVRWIAGVAAALLVLAVCAGFALRETFERAAIARTIATATGYEVTIDGVHHGSDALTLVGLHARSRGGGVVLDVPSIDVRRSADGTKLVIEAPHAALMPDRWRGDERARLLAGLGALPIDNGRLEATIHAGSVIVAGGSVPEAFAQFDRVEGRVASASELLTYHLTLALADGDTRYPMSADADVGRDGRVVATWSAAVLPLAPLTAVIPRDAPVGVQGGWLEDVVLSYGVAPPHFKATLDGGRLELRSSQTHELDDLGGDFEVGERSLGSTGLRGMLDGIPFEFSGEVSDVRSHLGWLVDGTPDLRGLGRLMLAVAGEPRLLAIRLESTAPGLAFAHYSIATDNGPLTVTSLLVNPREPTLRFDTAIAEDRIVSGGERTSAMGVRTHAVAGVNGDYFDIGRTYQPQGMLIRGGELLRGPTDRYALIVRRDGSVAFSEFHLRGTVTTPRARFPVTQLNNWPAGDVTIVTPSFGKVLPAWPGITFATLRPLDAVAHPSNVPTRYIVEDVRKTDEPLPIAFGLAFGPRIKGPLPRPGDRVTLSYELDPESRDAVAGIGGGPLLLKNGEWYEDRHAPAPDERDVRWPVIALGRFPDDTLLLIAVDGRHPERSIGMTRPEFATMLQRQGVVDAMALDSGGSVTLVSRAPGDENVSVRNQPSDNSDERWVSDALFLYSSAPPPEIVFPRSASTPLPEIRPTL
jgi:hypothetical protein